MEDRRGQTRLRAGAREQLDEVRCLARAARCDDRYAYRAGYACGQIELESVTRTVAVHRGEQDLARAGLDPPPRPLDRVEPRGRAAAFHVDLVRAVVAAFRIDREH